MSDTTLNCYLSSGTAAEMAAFTPSPPTPASGPDPLNLFHNTDDDSLNYWDGAAFQPFGGSGTVTNTGTLTSGKTIVGNGGVDVTVSSLTANLVASSSGTLAGAVAGANSRLVGSGSGGSGSAYSELTAGSGLTIGASSLALSTAALTRALTLGIDGGGSAITTGVKADLYVPYACTITAVTMLADQSGSIVVDIWKDTYANYPPTVADTITAAAKPTISAATKSQDTTLTGWTTSVSAGDTLRFNVDSAATVTRLTLVLTVTVS